MCKPSGGSFERGTEGQTSVHQTRTAIHLCTGQHADAQALNAWLERHGVEVIGFDDVYRACVHLLRRYERIPDLALVGTDWLMDDEINIVAFLRQTWPRVAVILYGGTHESPLVELLPLTRTCRGAAGLSELTSRSPDELLRELTADAGPPPSRPLVEWRDSAESDRGGEQRGMRAGDRAAAPRIEASEIGERSEEPRAALKLSNTESPRSILTAEELAALLDLPERK